MNNDTGPGPFACKVAPEMGSHNLLRVVPVAQQQQVGDVAVLIYSLELYETGFIAVTRLSWIGGTPTLPQMVWTARDEHGTEYPAMDRAGSGGGRPPDRFSWRLNWLFGAPISPRATTLQMAATTARFYSFPDADAARPHRERSVAGPWEFVIPLMNG